MRARPGRLARRYRTLDLYKSRVIQSPRARVRRPRRPGPPPDPRAARRRRAELRGDHRRDPVGVRDLAARPVPAPAGAARGRLRDRAPRRRAPAVRGRPRTAARRRRLARALPRVLDAPPGRARHRDRARPAPPPARPRPRREEGPVIDVAHHISTVERRVGRRTLPAGEARTVTIARVYPTSPEDLWDACTNAERISRWFLPVSGDLRPGGRYALEGNASGTIERCEPPHRMDATWEFGGAVSWIELRLAPEPGGGTRLTLDHIAAVDDEMWTRFGPGAVGIGWDGALLGLALHVEGGGALARDEAQAWMASEE